MKKGFDIDAFFRKVIQSYSDMLFRISLQYVRNRSDAEDVLQEVYVCLLKYIKKAVFNDEEHLKAWLIKVTVRKSINLFKYNARHRVTPLSENAGVQSRCAMGAGDLENALNRLDGTDREIVYLYYYEGYSVKEVASFVNKSEKNVYKRLSRARERLKEFITERR